MKTPAWLYRLWAPRRIDERVVCFGNGDYVPADRRHISERISPHTEPDFHDGLGRPYFGADKLRCRYCLTPWWEIVNLDPVKERARIELYGCDFNPPPDKHVSTILDRKPSPYDDWRAPVL